MKNTKTGNVFVFEGIDHVGKSTIVSELGKRLNELNIEFSTYSFPGKEDHTLGALVYDVHHNQDKYFYKPVDPLSLQMLHVAAHIDTINNRINRDINDGKVVLIDRFWWSTYAYGIANGIKKSLIKEIVLPEKRMLNKVNIAQYFFIRRESTKSGYSKSYTETLKIEYEKLCTDAKKCDLLTIIDNDSDISITVDSILMKITTCIEHNDYYNRKLDIGDRSENNKVSENITFFIKPLKIYATNVYDTYWKFASERQKVFFNRLNGVAYPWTEDSIIQRYKFTNAYRASDRVSQYLIREVIYSPNSYTPEDTFFRIILFKIFNKIGTWEYLQEKLGDIKFKDYSFEKYDMALTAALNDGKTIYSAAYIMPSGNSAFNHEKKHQNNLRLIEKMMADRLPMKIGMVNSMKELYMLLLSYPTLGKFLAFQYSIDINYSELCDFDEMSFVVAGPGAINGIRKCFQNTYEYSDEDLIKFVTESQGEEFKRLNLNFQTLWGRPLQLIDCQNLFCETDKYARVAFPESQGANNRKRIKQLFSPHSDINYFYPPKWNINQFIKSR